jgi:hypothetical protein
MRKGFFWATGVLLASMTPATAQDAAKPLVKESTGGVVNVALQPPVANLPTEVIRYFETQSQRPRGYWVSADYLLWWVKSGPIVPIVTTSNNLGDAPPGALNQPGTQIVFGDRSIGYGAASGLRVGAGIEIAPGLAIEGSYFILENRSQHFSISSDAKGAPLIGIPFFNTAIGLEDALLTSNPDVNLGVWTGTATVVSVTRLQGWELNLASQRVNRGGAFSFTALAGVRALSLDEDLSISNQFTPQIDGVLTFNGAGVPAGTPLSDADHFRTRNSFYGGQIGGRAEWQRGPLSLNVMGKIAFGSTQEVITIDGQSTMVSPNGVPTVAQGGIFAQTSNIGRYYHNAFAVVPEVGLNLSLAITERITAKMGYSFLYWSRVARPGDQIDRNIHEALIPTHQFFGLSTPDGRPAFNVRQTDFWAQGINFGLEYRY